MASEGKELINQEKSPGIFNTTHWSAVLSAARPDSPETCAAFAELCQNYRPPLLGFLLSKHQPPHDAEDLVQGFFEMLLRNRERKLQNVSPEKGKFRSFLLVSLKHFLRDEREKAAAKKRGGDVKLFSIDEQSENRDYATEPSDTRSPDREYDRRWADTVLGRALQALEKEMADAGQARTYQALVEFLMVKMPGRSHAEVAKQLGTTTGTVRNAVQRLRDRYGELIRAEISRTLANPTRSAVDEELAVLLQALE